MKAIPIESWDKMSEIQSWLNENFGPASADTWYVDIPPYIEELVMNDEIYVWFMLRWT